MPAESHLVQLWLQLGSDARRSYAETLPRGWWTSEQSENYFAILEADRRQQLIVDVEILRVSDRRGAEDLERRLLGSAE